MPHVEDVGLRGVPHDGDLARAVCATRHEVAQRKPAERRVVLAIERPIGPVIGVNEEMRLSFEVQQASIEKANMIGGDQVDLAVEP